MLCQQQGTRVLWESWCWGAVLHIALVAMLGRTEVKSANVSSGNFNLERKLKKVCLHQAFILNKNQENLGKTGKISHERFNENLMEM